MQDLETGALCSSPEYRTTILFKTDVVCYILKCKFFIKPACIDFLTIFNICDFLFVLTVLNILLSFELSSLQKMHL